MRCKECNIDIPIERLQHFAERGRMVKTCVNHSEEEAMMTVFVYDHKTAGYLMKIPNDVDGKRDPNLVNKAERFVRRSR